MKLAQKLSKFNAEFNSDVCNRQSNATLTLTVNLGFKQINPSDGKSAGTYHDYGDTDEPSRKIVKWTPGAWGQWKQKFVSSAAKFWDDKFCLINNFGLYKFEHNGTNYIPNIRCRFVLIGNNAGLGNNHHEIEVVRLHKDETWFGSHSKLYDSLDMNSATKSTDSAGNKVVQRAHVHEVGHLLGLGHVDIGKAHCPANSNTNEKPCYGVSDTDMNSVMGSGMQLRVKQANPWRTAMIAITGKGALLNETDWSGKLVKYYPRTEKEFSAGIMNDYCPAF